MTIYRNNKDGKLYILEHVIISMFTDRGATCGVYAYPLFESTRQGEVEIKLLTHSEQEVKQFVETNFSPVYER